MAGIDHESTRPKYSQEDRFTKSTSCGNGRDISFKLFAGSRALSSGLTSDVGPPPRNMAKLLQLLELPPGGDAEELGDYDGRRDQTALWPRRQVAVTFSHPCNGRTATSSTSSTTEKSVEKQGPAPATHTMRGILERPPASPTLTASTCSSRPDSSDSRYGRKHVQAMWPLAEVIEPIDTREKACGLKKRAKVFVQKIVAVPEPLPLPVNTPLPPMEAPISVRQAPQIPVEAGKTQRGYEGEMLELMKLTKCYSDKGQVLRESLPLAKKAHAMEMLAYKQRHRVVDTSHGGVDIRVEYRSGGPRTPEAVLLELRVFKAIIAREETLTALEVAVDRLNETYGAFVELEQKIVRYLPDFYGLEYTKRVRIEGSNPTFIQDPPSRPTTSGSSPSRPGTGDSHHRYSVSLWQAPHARPGSRATELKHAEEPYKPFLVASEDLRRRVIHGRRRVMRLVDCMRASSFDVIDAVVQYRDRVHRKTFKKHGDMSELHDAFMWKGENYLLKMRRDLVFLDDSPCVRHWLGLLIEGLCPPFLVYPTHVPNAEARLQVLLESLAPVVAKRLGIKRTRDVRRLRQNMKSMADDGDSEKKGGLLGEVDGGSDKLPAGNTDDGQLMAPSVNMGSAVQVDASDDPLLRADAGLVAVAGRATDGSCLESQSSGSRASFAPAAQPDDKAATSGGGTSGSESRPAPAESQPHDLRPAPLHTRNRSPSSRMRSSEVRSPGSYSSSSSSSSSSNKVSSQMGPGERTSIISPGGSLHTLPSPHESQPSSPLDGGSRGDAKVGTNTGSSPSSRRGSRRAFSHSSDLQHGRSSGIGGASNMPRSSLHRLDVDLDHDGVQMLHSGAQGERLGLVEATAGNATGESITPTRGPVVSPAESSLPLQSARHSLYKAGPSPELIEAGRKSSFAPPSPHHGSPSSPHKIASSPIRSSSFGLAADPPRLTEGESAEQIAPPTTPTRKKTSAASLRRSQASRTPRAGSMHSPKAGSSGRSDESPTTAQQQDTIMPYLRVSIIAADEEGQEASSAGLQSSRGAALSPLTICVDDGHVDPRGFYEDDLQTADTSITLASSMGPCPTPVSRQRGPGFVDGFSDLDGTKSPGVDATPDLELMAAMGAQPLVGLTEEGFKAMVEVSISQDGGAMPAWLQRRRSSSSKRRRSVQGGKEMEAAVQEEIDYQQTEREIVSYPQLMPSQDLLPRLQSEASAATSSTLPSPRKPSFTMTGQETTIHTATSQREPDMFALGPAALFGQTIAAQAPANVVSLMTSAESARVVKCLKLLDEEVITEATDIDHILAPPQSRALPPSVKSPSWCVQPIGSSDGFVGADGLRRRQLFGETSPMRRHNTAPVGCTDSASPARPGADKGSSPWYFVTQPPGTAPPAAQGATNAKWWEAALVPAQTKDALPVGSPLDVSRRVLHDLGKRRKAASRGFNRRGGIEVDEFELYKEDFEDQSPRDNEEEAAVESQAQQVPGTSVDHGWSLSNYQPALHGGLRLVATIVQAHFRGKQARKRVREKRIALRLKQVSEDLKALKEQNATRPFITPNVPQTADHEDIANDHQEAVCTDATQATPSTCISCPPVAPPAPVSNVACEADQANMCRGPSQLPRSTSGPCVPRPMGALGGVSEPSPAVAPEDEEPLGPTQAMPRPRFQAREMPDFVVGPSSPLRHAAATASSLLHPRLSPEKRRLIAQTVRSYVHEEIGASISRAEEAEKAAAAYAGATLGDRRSKTAPHGLHVPPPSAMRHVNQRPSTDPRFANTADPFPKPGNRPPSSLPGLRASNWSAPGTRRQLAQGPKAMALPQRVIHRGKFCPTPTPTASDTSTLARAISITLSSANNGTDESSWGVNSDASLSAMASFEGEEGPPRAAPTLQPVEEDHD